MPPAPKGGGITNHVTWTHKKADKSPPQHDRYYVLRGTSQLNIKLEKTKLAESVLVFDDQMSLQSPLSI